MLYAMGITQHTSGAQNVKSFAVLQTLMGNMGRYGGGINALRGIHNVQGSTDMGLLYGNIPAYSGNPTHCPAAVHRCQRLREVHGCPVGQPALRTAAAGPQWMATYADAYVPGA